MKKLVCLLLMSCILFIPKETYAAKNEIIEDCNGDLSIEEGAEEYVLTEEDILRNFKCVRLS